MTARVVQVSVLRYTPSGVPVVSLEIEHTSTIARADSEQALQFSVEASAVGDAAHAASLLKLGDVIVFEGYWAPAHYRTKRIQFHILKIQTA